ncbi:hypothetical protein BXZ70DRAFT_32547 [Cristinia sonorae]|uniref:Uncharacterized protein n=1 Tax=Cristinia sonorae TaxID=1940300 RepID=A0A8K0XV64_9AGAR|nr:hypothetical protein BXZ70DRAFT_32547 [Cristinia sonorae]
MMHDLLICLLRHLINKLRILSCSAHLLCISTKSPRLWRLRISRVSNIKTHGSESYQRSRQTVAVQYRLAVRFVRGMKVNARQFLILSATFPLVLASVQESFSAYGYVNGQEQEIYRFQHPVRKVAIIGAGVGGLISYRELTQTGFEVHLYERDNSPSGNWHYTDEVPVDAPIPNRDISVGDYEPDLPPEGVKYPYTVEYVAGKGGTENEFRQRVHRAPKPGWKTLSSNAPAPIQQIRETPWPAGTAWELPILKLQRYLRAFASWHGLNSNDDNPNVWYNTRVELVEKHKDGNGWSLTLKKLVKTGNDRLKATWWKQDYDAVVVATGRYNAPNIPNIEGLAKWNEKFPGHVLHSRQYRVPEPFANQTVLVVGAHNSGGEIARDIIKHAGKVYQSIRPSTAPVPVFAGVDFLARVPYNVSIIPEIKRFLPPTPGSQFKDGRIELFNGTILTGIDKIIFATGFRYSYPFLPGYHNSSLGLDEQVPHDVAFQPIVSDGTHLRALYLDAFYIPDPTLVFINMNYGMQSFTHAEFTSLAAAQAWSGTADFPSTKKQWEWFDGTYERRKGYGRHFQYLSPEETKETLRHYVGWLNSAAAKYGGRQIDQLPTELPQISELWRKSRFAAAPRPDNTSLYELDAPREVFAEDGSVTYWNGLVGDW